MLSVSEDFPAFPIRAGDLLHGTIRNAIVFVTWDEGGWCGGLHIYPKGDEIIVAQFFNSPTYRDWAGWETLSRAKVGAEEGDDG